jgi:hypothetical protein
MVSHSKGGAQIEDAGKQSAEENIWTLEEWSDRLEKITSWEAPWNVFFTKYYLSTRLHTATYQETVIFILNTMRTYSLIILSCFRAVSGYGGCSEPSKDSG